MKFIDNWENVFVLCADHPDIISSHLKDPNVIGTFNYVGEFELTL